MAHVSAKRIDLLSWLSWRESVECAEVIGTFGARIQNSLSTSIESNLGTGLASGHSAMQTKIQMGRKHMQCSVASMRN